MRPHRVLITEAVHAGLEPLGRRLAVELRPGLWADRQGLLSEVQGSAGEASEAPAGGARP